MAHMRLNQISDELGPEGMVAAGALIFGLSASGCVMASQPLLGGLTAVCLILLTLAGC